MRKNIISFISISFLLFGLFNCRDDEERRDVSEVHEQIMDNQPRCFFDGELDLLRSFADGSTGLDSSEETRRLVAQTVHLAGNHLDGSLRQASLECLSDADSSSDCESVLAETVQNALDEGYICDGSPPIHDPPPPSPSPPTPPVDEPVRNDLERPITTTTPGGSTITTIPNETISVTTPDGATAISTPDGTATTTSPDGTTTTTQAADGTITTTTQAPDGATITTTQASDGTTTTTAPDGTTTTTTVSPDGTTTITTEAPDGTTTTTTVSPNGTVTTTAPDGVTVTTQSDGTTTTTSDDITPVTESDGTVTTTTSDGTRITTTPDGTTSTTTTAPDGTTTTTSVAPDRTVTNIIAGPDGTTRTTTTAPDGTTTTSTTAPDGTTTTAAPDDDDTDDTIRITVTAPDGTTTTTEPEGTVTVEETDDTISVATPDGTTTTTESEGTVSVTTSDHTTTSTAPDGGVTTTTTEPDGTIITTTDDGAVITRRPDDVTPTVTRPEPELPPVSSTPPPIVLPDEDSTPTPSEFDRNPRNTPGGGFMPALTSTTPPSESPAPGEDSVLTSPAGNVTIPSEPSERNTLLSDQYNANRETVNLPGRPSPKVSISNRVVPETLNTDDFRQTSNFLLDPEVRLNEDGVMPYYRPADPGSFNHETNSYRDPAFADLALWQKDYWFARFHSGSNGHVLYLLDYGYGRRRTRQNSNNDNLLYIKQDELYVGWPYEQTFRGIWNSDDLADPTKLHVPLRKTHTISISDPVPTLSSSSVTACSDEVTGNGTRTNPFKIHNFQQLDDYLRRFITAYFEIECDIDASPSKSQNDGAGFVPIRYFAGFVDGKGHKIVGLHINRPGEHQVGLFAQLLGSKIENLTIENAHVTGKYQVGILAGHMVRSLVDSVKVTGRVQGVGETGGLIGFQTSHFYAYTRGIVYEKPDIMKLFIPYRTAQVKKSHAKVLVNCVRGSEDKYYHRMCGGLVGWMGSGFIDSSSSSGNLIMSEAAVGDGSSVKIDGDMAGGIVGVIGTRTNDGGVLLIESDSHFGGADVFQQARVYRSFSTMNIYGGLSIGGLVGLALRGGIIISESYTKNVRIEGHAMLAGLVSVLEGSYVVNCHVLNNKIYTHYDDGERFVDLATSPSVYSFVGYSDAIFTDSPENNRNLAVIYHRGYARYLASSRFKLGIQNTYADSRTYFFLDGARRGRMRSFINNITGSYYLLNGTAGFVVETVLDNYEILKFARNRGTGTGSGLLSYTAMYPLYPNMTDLWNRIDFSEISQALGSNGRYAWRKNGVDSRHLATRDRSQLTCPTTPGMNCRSAGSGTFTGWSTSIWNFGTNADLPEIINAVSDPGL